MHTSVRFMLAEGQGENDVLASMMTKCYMRTTVSFLSDDCCVALHTRSTILQCLCVLAYINYDERFQVCVYQQALS